MSEEAKSTTFFNPKSCFKRSTAALRALSHLVCFELLLRECQEQPTEGVTRVMVTVRLGPRMGQGQTEIKLRSVSWTVSMPSSTGLVPNPWDHYYCFEYWTRFKAPRALEYSVVFPGKGPHMYGVDLQEALFRELKASGRGKLCNLPFQEFVYKMIGNAKLGPKELYSLPYSFMQVRPTRLP